MTSRLRAVVWLPALVTLALIAWWLSSYHPSEYRGAGTLRDSGLLSHYRYRAPVGSFPFNEEGTYTFNFSGLPSERMDLELYVPGYSAKNGHDIEALRTLISAAIIDQSGVTICAASGAPAGSAADRWTLSASPFDAAFWHEACSGRQFKRSTNYTLRLKIHDPDPRTPAVHLTAVLEGGGIDLP
jgi:hypothetical protein